MSDTVMNRFQHLLEALGMGCPPHGGLALGFDRYSRAFAWVEAHTHIPSLILAPLRLVAILCHAESLREVIAFPKTATGSELMTGAPSEPTTEELGEYHISIIPAQA